MIHLHSGDSSADIHKAFMPDSDIKVWTDLLHEGPLPPQKYGIEAFRKIRAKSLSNATGGAISPERCLNKLTSQDAALEALKSNDGITLWFDACMYDQLILICILERINRMKLHGKNIFLVCAGEFPGFAKLWGLGELNGEQLLSLLPKAVKLTPKNLANASEAWNAVCSENPNDIIDFTEKNLSIGSAYLNEALFRFAEQFPSRANGLSKAQEYILSSISDRAWHSPLEVFKTVSSMEKRPFAGDTTVYSYINNMASGKYPLLEINPDGKLPQWCVKSIESWRIKITDAGIEVLSCRKDLIELNGINSFLGGVRLETENHWRYNSIDKKFIRGKL